MWLCASLPYAVCFGGFDAYNIFGKGICYSVQGGFNDGHVIAGI